jgi:hypothetical protein
VEIPVKILRERALLQGLTMMVVVVAAAYPAHAAIKPSAVVVHISGRVDATADPVPNQGCVGRMYPLSGTAIYKGTLAGVGGFCTQAKLPVVTPSGLAYHEEHTFVGTVKRCGTGTFRYTVDGVSHAPDPAKGIPADEYWRITKGSGTGGLVGIRSGLNHRTGAITTGGTVFAVFDPAMNSLTCIPTHRKK